MRLVDADALIQEIREDNEGYYFNSITEREVNFAKVDYAIDRISEAPTIEERPTGQWIVTGEEQGALGITYKIRKCSNCSWEHSLVIPNNFCPNCGAKMTNEAENEKK